MCIRMMWAETIDTQHIVRMLPARLNMVVSVHFRYNTSTKTSIYGQLSSDSAGEIDES